MTMPPAVPNPTPSQDSRLSKQVSAYQRRAALANVVAGVFWVAAVGSFSLLSGGKHTNVAGVRLTTELICFATLFTLWAARTIWFTLGLRRSLRQGGDWKRWRYTKLRGAGMLLIDPDDPHYSIVAVVSALGRLGRYRPERTGTLLAVGDPRVFAIVKADDELRPVVLSPPRRPGRRNALYQNVLDEVPNAP